MSFFHLPIVYNSCDLINFKRYTLFKIIKAPLKSNYHHHTKGQEVIYRRNSMVTNISLIVNLLSFINDLFELQISRTGENDIRFKVSKQFARRSVRINFVLLFVVTKSTSLYSFKRKLQMIIYHQQNNLLFVLVFISLRMGCYGGS